MSENTVTKKEIPVVQRSRPIDIPFPRGFVKKRPKRQYRFYSDDDYIPVRLVPNEPGTSTRNTFYSSDGDILNRMMDNTADEAQSASQYFNALAQPENEPSTSTATSTDRLGGNNNSTEVRREQSEPGRSTEDTSSTSQGDQLNGATQSTEDSKSEELVQSDPGTSENDATKFTEEEPDRT